MFIFSSVCMMHFLGITAKMHNNKQSVGGGGESQYEKPIPNIQGKLGGCKMPNCQYRIRLCNLFYLLTNRSSIKETPLNIKIFQLQETDTNSLLQDMSFTELANQVDPEKDKSQHCTQTDKRTREIKLHKSYRHSALHAT